MDCGGRNLLELLLPKGSPTAGVLEVDQFNLGFLFLATQNTPLEYQSHLLTTSCAVISQQVIASSMRLSLPKCAMRIIIQILLGVWEDGVKS